MRISDWSSDVCSSDLLIAAGLVARKARALGLTRKPWVKSSLAPGSQVVTDYLNKSGLTADLDALGFNLVGSGCTTCIGNSGPLPEPISKAINEHDQIGRASGRERVCQDVYISVVAVSL